LLQEEIAEHKRTRQPFSPRDFIDLYLEKLDEEKSVENSTFHGIQFEMGWSNLLTKMIYLKCYCEEEQLLATIFDIVIGSETTSHTLGFSLLFMIFHPQIQSKVQEEIDEILQGRTPSLTDRGR